MWPLLVVLTASVGNDATGIPGSPLANGQAATGPLPLVRGIEEAVRLIQLLMTSAPYWVKPAEIWVRIGRG